jgi:hypothetical protein
MNMNIKTMGRRSEQTAPPPHLSMGFKEWSKTLSRPKGSKPSSTGDADTSASTPPTSISFSSSSSGASKSTPCDYVRLLHDEQDTRLPLSHAGRLPPESIHYSRRSSCNDALPAARLDGRGDRRPSIRRINSDHIGGSFQRRPISRIRGEASGRGGRSPLRSSSPPVSGCGRHPQFQGRHTSKERHMSRGTRDISRQRSASTGRPTSSRGRPAASNVQPTSSMRPPSRGRPSSKSRPVMNSGGGRSQSRGRDRSPPAYADSKALVLRRRSMSPPHRDPRGVNRQGAHPRQSPSMENNNRVEYKPCCGGQSDSVIPTRTPSRIPRRETDSAVPPSRRSQTEAATRSHSRSARSLVPGVDDSLERNILSVYRRANSLHSTAEDCSMRRKYRTDRRLPEWSDVNTNTRRKTTSLSKLSQEVRNLSMISRQVSSTSSRRNSSPRSRSPSSGSRVPTSIKYQQLDKSLERAQPTIVARKDTLDSCNKTSRRREHLSLSEASGLSMRSQKTSASSTITSNPPSVTIEKRSPDTSPNKSQHHQGKSGTQRAREAKKDAYASLLKVVKETQDENLPRMKSAEEVQSRPKPRSSSMKALSPMSDAAPLSSQTSPPGPGVHDASFDVRQASANGRNASSNSIAGPSSIDDRSPSPRDFSGVANQDAYAFVLKVIEESQSSDERPSMASATNNKHSFSSASNQTPPPPPPKQNPPPPPPPRTNDASNNMHIGTSTTTQSHKAQEVMSVQQHPLQQVDSMMRVQRQPDCQYQEAPEVGKSKEWMKYTMKGSRREITEDESDNGKTGQRGRRKVSGKNEQIKSCNVKQMPFTDQFGDFGYYTGQVDDEGRPNGKGAVKYENGVFYEGTWVDGCQDKLAASQYERIRGGFTSWSGKGKGGTKSGSTLPWNVHKNDAFDGREKTNVRGLDWTDLNGDSGRYTGEVDNDQLPHGSGVMRYDYGLIAEGEWVHGVLKEGPHDRMISAAAMNGGQSVAPGMPINSGMSVGPGALGYAGGAISVLGAGGMSVAPPVGFAGGMGLLAANPMQFRGMNASQHAMLAHQNAMMKMHGGAGGSVYVGGGGGNVYHGGAGSVYGGTGMVMHMQQMPPMSIQPMQHVGLQQEQQNHQPPISNIVIK